MFPATVQAARTLLIELGAPPRLLRHVELVSEAGDLLIAAISGLGVPIDASLIAVGIVLHDAGKVLHPAELQQSGNEHEGAGESLLLSHGVTPALAHMCVSHAQWKGADVSLEELLVALSDTLWKGVRRAKLEECVVDRIAGGLGVDRWDVFIQLDNVFEGIATGGADRLERSRA